MKKLYSLLLLLITPVLLQASPFPFDSDRNDVQIQNLKTDALARVRKHKLHGWCPSFKTEQMIDLIIKTKPKICVEIGVFEGASVYPTIRALQYNKDLGHPQGVVYAIDPWRNDEALKNHAPTSSHAIFWGRVDFRHVKNKFIKTLDAERMRGICTVIAKTSANAVADIPDNIDILHIDGNHTEPSSVQDVQLYLPKVKEGGYIWFGDISWPTTQKAQNLLLQECDLIYKFVASEDTPNDERVSYMLVQKRVKSKEVIPEPAKKVAPEPARETEDTPSKETPPSPVDPVSSKKSEKSEKKKRTHSDEAYPEDPYPYDPSIRDYC